MIEATGLTKMQDFPLHAHRIGLDLPWLALKKGASRIYWTKEPSHTWPVDTMEIQYIHFMESVHTEAFLRDGREERCGANPPFPDRKK